MKKFLLISSLLLLVALALSISIFLYISFVLHGEMLV
jgi:hypothetical protein